LKVLLSQVSEARPGAPGNLFPPHTISESGLECPHEAA
jgi:hypothetical protein